MEFCTGAYNANNTPKVLSCAFTS